MEAAGRKWSARPNGQASTFALLIGSSGVLQPTRLMPITWVVMCPVNHSTLGVPLVHAIESDGVAQLQ